MKMIAFVIALFSFSAFSAEIKVLDLPEWGLTYKSATFNVNKELGRAWVEVTIDDRNHHDRGYRGEVYQKLVDGLSYDGRTVRLDHEGQMFECADLTVRGRSIFRYNQVSLTGCKFEKRVVTVLRDTGYDITSEKRLQVFLITK